jgi:hypothetical protein
MRAFALEGRRGWPWGNRRIEGADAKLKSFLVLRLHVIQSCVENRHKAKLECVVHSDVDGTVDMRGIVAGRWMIQRTEGHSSSRPWQLKYRLHRHTAIQDPNSNGCDSHVARAETPPIMLFNSSMASK